ncbi:MAG TPA: hypothetical protein VGB93_02560, partial [Methylovirgula sp.]
RRKMAIFGAMIRIESGRSCVNSAACFSGLPFRPIAGTLVSSAAGLSQARKGCVRNADFRAQNTFIFRRIKLAFAPSRFACDFLFCFGCLDRVSGPFAGYGQGE